MEAKMSSWKTYGRPRGRGITTRRQWVETWVETHSRSGDEPRDRAVAAELRALWAIKDAVETCRDDWEVCHSLMYEALDAYEADQ